MDYNHGLHYKKYNRIHQHKKIKKDLQAGAVPVMDQLTAAMARVLPVIPYLGNYYLHRKILFPWSKGVVRVLPVTVKITTYLVEIVEIIT
jgi:hypothetical protein